MMANDLMGLGVNSLLAQRTANGGTGPLTATAAGTNYSTSTKILTAQFVVSVSNANGTVALGLPVVGTDNGAMLTDDYTINNAGSTSLQVFASTGVLISMSGSNGSQQKVQAHNTACFFPISTTQWIGVSGS